MADIFLISGGCRSGKSKFALELASAYAATCYLATAQVYDDEMAERVRRHREERGQSVRTIEEPFDILSVLGSMEGEDVLLWDCLTLWLSNMLCGGHKEDVILDKLNVILNSLLEADHDTIIVTNEVGMGIVPESKLGRQFRDLTGFAHQLITPKAKEAYLVAMGIPLALKRMGEFSL